MKTALSTWHNQECSLHPEGWRFRLDCCGFAVISDQTFDTKVDAEAFANHLIDKFLPETVYEHKEYALGRLLDE